MPPESERAASEQYFVERPHSSSRRRELRFLYRGDILSFETDRGVFASSGLDPGTALLIENLEVGEKDRILDLGCGWGAIGIAAARSAPKGSVLLTDVNRRSVMLARGNLRRNSVSNAEVRQGSLYEPSEAEQFDLIATNPPYHAGRPAVLSILEGAPTHLRPPGRLVIVGKGSQGIRFYQAWLEERWKGGVEVLARGSGYRVLEARWAAPTFQR